MRNRVSLFANFTENRGVLFFLFLALALLSAVVCSCRENKANWLSPESQALKYYSEGMYRHSNVELGKKKKLNALDYYLQGRNYQELREYDQAVDAFAHVNLEEISNPEQRRFFQEHFSYYYIQSLIQSPVVYTNSLEIVSRLIPNLPTNSQYYTDVMGIYAYFLLKNGNYPQLTNTLNNQFLTNHTSRRELALYRNIALFMLGDRSLLDKVLNGYRVIPYNFPYQAVLSNIQTNELNTVGRLTTAISIARRLENYELAEKYLQQHSLLFKDSDYFYRTQAQIDYAQDKKQQAISDLQKFTASGKASLATYELLITYLNRVQRYGEAYALVDTLMKKYPSSFYGDYFSALANTGKYEQIYNWYVANETNYVIRRRFSNRVLRMMLQHKPEYAQKLIDQRLKASWDYSSLLISALLNYEQGKTKTGYLQFLDITLNYPYTYEWLVAKKYERELRSKYKEDYRKTVDAKIATFAKIDIKDRLLTSLALRETDPEIFQSQVGESNFQALLRQYRTTLTNFFTVPAEIKELNTLCSNSELLAWNYEVYNYVEGLLDKVCTNSSKSANERMRTRYTYHYRDLYKNLKLDGVVVSRLNNYFYDVVGARRYQALLPEDIQKEAYPLVVFDTIDTVISNTNNSLWILSSFREESHFRKHVTSWVGAVGYAQVMPYTARLLKKQMKRPELHNRDFSDNVLLGLTLFKWLFKKYKSNYVYALGAYNAGEGAVDKWRKRYPKSNELWIDCVEYTETRDYIKRIMGTRMTYDRLYGFKEFDYAELGK